MVLNLQIKYKVTIYVSNFPDDEVKKRLESFNCRPRLPLGAGLKVSNPRVISVTRGLPAVLWYQIETVKILGKL